MKISEIGSELKGINIVPIDSALDEKEKHQEYVCLALKINNPIVLDRLKGIVILIRSKSLDVITPEANQSPFRWGFTASKLYFYAGAWIGNGSVGNHGIRWVPKGLASLVDGVLQRTNTGFAVLRRWEAMEGNLVVPYIWTGNTEGWILKSKNTIKKGFRHILKEFKIPQETSVSITINTLWYLRRILDSDDLSSNRMAERLYNY